jgi:hypothetical protein
MADVTPLRSPGIGHNKPPEPVEINMVSGDPAIVRARLEREYAPLVRRLIELDLGVKKLPVKITSEEEAARVLNWVAHQCTPLKTDAKAAHDREKKPYLAGAVIDNFFNAGIRDRVDLIISAGNKLNSEYRRQKEREQRQREEAEKRSAAEEQRRAIVEARRLAEAARVKEMQGDRSAAVALTKEAEEQQTRAAVAEAIVAAPPAPVRLHGEYGATGFAVKRWTFNVVDPMEIPFGYLKPDDEAIQQAIDESVRDTGKPPIISGLEIVEVERFQTRRC